jgi:hypothetical protein
MGAAPCWAPDRIGKNRPASLGVAPVQCKAAQHRRLSSEFTGRTLENAQRKGCGQGMTRVLLGSVAIPLLIMFF